ncbi:MAG: c-type cytochrome [Gammaproteobacteria bacterium]
MNKATLALVASLTTLLAACGQPDKAPATEAAAPAVEAAAPAAEVAPAAEAAAVVAEAAAPANEAGEKAYKSTCAMCHASGAAGAPIVGNKDDWAPRIAQGNDTLYKHAIEGYTGAKGMMPAKGGNASLADDVVKGAVDYMVAKSQ